MTTCVFLEGVCVCVCVCERERERERKRERERARSNKFVHLPVSPLCVLSDKKL